MFYIKNARPSRRKTCRLFEHKLNFVILTKSKSEKVLSLKIFRESRSIKRPETHAALQSDGHHISILKKFICVETTD